MVSVEGEPTVLSVFNDVTEQVNAEQSLRASEQRLAEQSEALTTLTAQEASPAPCFEKRLAELLEAAARTLHVERVSIWLRDSRATSSAKRYAREGAADVERYLAGQEKDARG